MTTSTSTSNKARFLENAKRINDALGDPIPACTPAMLDEANRAETGEIWRAPDGTVAVIDLDATDWTCSKTPNPETVQMHLLRYHILVPLAAAFRQTRDEKYPRIARRFIEAFLRDHPMVEGWAPKRHDGATQYDLRIGSSECPGWLGTLHFFAESKTFDDAFIETILAAARIHMLHLAKNVYPDRNIRAMNGEVLVVNGVRLSFLAEAAGWRTQGVRVVNDVIRRQILPDGAHMEAVPGYHGGVMTLLTSLWRLSRAMPELGLEIPSERIAAMYDYHLAATRPDGELISMHDSRYAPPTLAKPTPLGGLRAALRKEAGLPAITPPNVQVFPDAGQAYLRDDWSADATYLTFDATTRRSFHWHPGRNAITLFAHGRALLVDTGYPFATAEFPKYGHRTAHHSTLNLNGWNQSHTNAQMRVRRAPGYELVEGFYAGGYWPLETYFHGPGLFGEHHRTLLWVHGPNHGRVAIVIDNINTTSEVGHKPSVESVWQLSQGPVDIDPAGFRATTRHDRGNLLMLFPLVPEGAALTKHEGEREGPQGPMRGWVPTEWGRLCEPAPMLRVAAKEYDPWQANLVTVLVPFASGPAPKIEASAVGPDLAFGGRIAGRLDLRWADGTTDRVMWIRRLENAITRQHGIDTDASLVHLRFGPDGKLAGGLTVDGHFLVCEELGGQDRIGDVARC
ncbi:MAG: heparinase II/III family protein [Planctomycetota bacterium]|nr:heparinase II/III family protein [Planctomycetota bacterium]